MTTLCYVTYEHSRPRRTGDLPDLRVVLDHNLGGVADNFVGCRRLRFERDERCIWGAQLESVIRTGITGIFYFQTGISPKYVVGRIRFYYFE